MPMILTKHIYSMGGNNVFSEQLIHSLTDDHDIRFVRRDTDGRGRRRNPSVFRISNRLRAVGEYLTAVDLPANRSSRIARSGGTIQLHRVTNFGLGRAENEDVKRGI